MIVDHIKNWKSYAFGPAWEEAFAFLETLDAESEDGEFPIDGETMFARVMSYQTRNETDPEAVLEAHRKYVDIQMTLVESERIACYPLHTLDPKDPYCAERDVQFFQYAAPADLQLSVFPGTFVCLLPQDTHMPQLNTGPEAKIVKKVVVKISRDALEI